LSQVFRDFNEYFAVFACKTYDALDPEDSAFLNDYEEFQQKVTDLDRRLSSILCQAFDDCHELDSIFKLINIVGTILNRPLIKERFTGKYNNIVTLVDKELSETEVSQFSKQNIFQVLKLEKINRNSLRSNW